MAVALDANNMHLLVFDRRSGAPVFGLVSRYPEANKEYVSQYGLIDERVPRILALPHAVPTHHESLFRGTEMQSSATYNEFLAKYDAQSQLITRMNGPAGDSIVFSAIREKGRGAFVDAETKKIRQLLPHVLQAVRIRQSLASVSAENRPLAALLDGSRLAVFFLDRDGHVLEANASACRILRRRDGLTSERGLLRASFRKEDAELQALIAGALGQGTGVATGSGGLLRISRPSMGRPLVLLVVPIRSAQADFGARRPVAAVFSKDSDVPLALSADKISQLHGLTQAESNLVAALMRGQSVRQYAEAGRRSEHTVRWTLKNAMSKTGTHSQADLVRLILSDASFLSEGRAT